MSTALLLNRRFAPLFATQFLGAFNDNLFKSALVVLLTWHGRQWTTLPPGLLANLAAGLFILPYFLFSATAGQFADKFDKARLARLVKVLEIGIALLAGAGLLLHALALLLTSLFLLGLHSTLFGPLKYALLPQHLLAHELVAGNALVEAGTFVAILAGTLAGGTLAALSDGATWIAATCLAAAVAGYLASRHIPVAPAPAPELRIDPNPLAETWRNIGLARADRTVFLSILGISWFWLYGATLLAQFPAYAREVLGGGEQSVTLLLATFTVGSGLGALACARLCGGRVRPGVVLAGALGLALAGFGLARAHPAAHAASPCAMTVLVREPGVASALICLLAIGFCGGLFVVPLYALMQERANPALRARIVAANNILNALFMVGGAAAAAGLLASGLSIPALFALAAAGNGVLALLLLLARAGQFRLGLQAVPAALLRALAWLLVHGVYRLDRADARHIPARGAALLVSNHVSFADALVISAACQRPVRFVMDHRIFRQPLLCAVFRAARAIPIAPAREDAAVLELALAEIEAALAAGELVALFPEGALTRDGEVGTFRSGVARILERSPVPVLPVALSGLWGSVFSYRHASLRARLLSLRLFRRIRLSVGCPVPAHLAQPEVLRAQVLALRGQTP